MKSDEILKLIRTDFQKYMITLFKSKKIYETTKVSKPDFKMFLKECVPAYCLYEDIPAGETKKYWWIDNATISDNEQ